MKIVQPLDLEREAKCPKCANTHGIRDGGPSLRGRRFYDIQYDTWGVMRCPACGYRAGSAAFRKPPKTN